MIKVPNSFKTKEGSSHQLYGLCGTFDGDRSNDFLSISGSTPYSSVESFTAQWKQGAECKENNLSPPNYSPASGVDPVSHAQKLCSVIKTDPFLACHSSIPVASYENMCMHDVVKCNFDKRSDCVCNSLAMYARACQKRANTTLSWRSASLCREYTFLCGYRLINFP